LVSRSYPTGILWQNRYFPTFRSLSANDPSVIIDVRSASPLTGRTAPLSYIHTFEVVVLRFQTFAVPSRCFKVYLDASFCCFPRSLGVPPVFIQTLLPNFVSEMCKGLTGSVQGESRCYSFRTLVQFEEPNKIPNTGGV
jgi:hypothetical protein